MSILDDGKPVPVSRFAGQVDYQGPQKVINGCAVLARNVDYSPDTAKTRFGLRTTMARQQANADVTGIDVLEVLGLVNPGSVPVVFTALGELLEETPLGSGALTPLSAPFTLPTNSRMQTTQADNSLFMGFDNGRDGLLPPLQYLGQTKQVLPVSQNPVGATWASGLLYRVGDLVRSVDGRWWRCNRAGASVSTATPPVWPQYNGGFVGAAWFPSQVADVAGGNSRWEEWTPNCTNVLVPPDTVNCNATLVDNPGAGSIAASKDVYIELTYSIPGVGETQRSVPLVFVDTGANDQITVQIQPQPGHFGGPLMPRWMAEIVLQPLFFAPFMVNVYVAAVATGAAAPANNAYNLYHTLAVGTEIVVSSVGSAPSGAVHPTVDAGGYANPGNAFDGNFATASVGKAIASFGNPQNVSETWSGWAARGAGQTGLAINVSSSVVETGSGAIAEVTYSLDGGATFHTIYATGISRGKTIDVVPLSNTQDLTMVQVKALVSAFAPPGSASSATQSMWEIWISQPGAVGGTILTAPPIQLLTPGEPASFRGANGARYMIVCRQNPQGSLAPVDVNSALPITIQGTVTVNILTITRDGSGNVEATVTDITQFAPGQQIQVVACSEDPTFNNTGFVLTNVTPTQAPEGILAWSDPNNASGSQDSTGSVVLLPSSPPVAFLPPGGTEDALDIAAFTVVDGSADGPFFYVASSDPTNPVTAQIVSLTGEGDITTALSAITRYAGGQCTAGVANLAGLAPGMLVSIQGVTGDASFNEQVVLTTVQPTGGSVAGLVGWNSVNNTASTGTITNATLTTSVEPGTVIAVVQNAAGLAPGIVVAIEGSVPSGTSSFNQLATIAQVVGTTVILSMQSLGTGTGGQMVVQQNLPTSSPSGSTTITAITRDPAGNVLAQVSNLGFWEPGHIANVAGVTDASFDGQFEVVTAALNPDGLSGVLGWSQSGQAQSASVGGAVSSFNDVTINYDEASLSAEFDITDQLSSLGAPVCSDLYFVPSFAMMAYVDNQHYPSAFLFSNPQDPGNITGSSGDPNNPGSGILSVDANAQKRAIGVREMRSGEVLLIKENGGFKVENSDLFPSNWNPSRRWDEFGPFCAEAMALSNSDESDFLAFASEYGAFVYMGGTLQKLSREIGKTWKRINIAAAKMTAAVGIDVERRKISFLLPLDGATTPNYELTMSYYDGWGPPEVLNRYGKLITARECRKWSIQPFNARTCKYIHRNIHGVAPAQSIGGEGWAYTGAVAGGGICTFNFANAAAVPPVKVAQSIYSPLTGTVVVNQVTPPTIVTAQGVAANGATGASSLFMVTEVQPPSTDERVATKQMVYGQAGATAPLQKLVLSSVSRSAGVVTAKVALAGYVPAPSELANVVVTGALDPSFNGTFATTSQVIVGQVLTLTWNQALPPSNSAGILFTTLSMTRVTMVTPDVYDDDGIGIDFQYQPWLTQAPPATLDYLGFRGTFGGSGFAGLIVTSDVAGDVLPTRILALVSAIGQVSDPPGVLTFEEVIRFKREYCTAIITNLAMPGSYVQIQTWAAYVQEWLTAPRGTR